MNDKRIRRMAVLSLILGIASDALSFVVPYAAVICAFGGIVLGRRTKAWDSLGKAGFICSIAGLVLFGAVVVIAVLYALRLPSQ